MNRIKYSLLGALLAVGFTACVDDAGSSGFQSAVTGEPCEPDPATLQPHGHSGEHGNGGQNSPTGIPGDNMDDEHSGQVDCYYDGNSGQGDDKKHPCCDANMCCNVPPEEVPPDEEQPPEETPPEETPPDDGEPVPEPPPTDPTDPEPVIE
jgi:hypothetical protein